MKKPDLNKVDKDYKFHYVNTFPFSLGQASKQEALQDLSNKPLKHRRSLKILTHLSTHPLYKTASPFNNLLRETNRVDFGNRIKYHPYLAEKVGIGLILSYL